MGRLVDIGLYSFLLTPSNDLVFAVSLNPVNPVFLSFHKIQTKINNNGVFSGALLREKIIE